MAIMWNGSLVPWIDPNGAPYSGAKAYFFDAGTTTPRTVYQDSGLGESHDHPVLANASGQFPAIFLPSGDFRLRITTAADVTIWDVDGISAPIAETPEAPEGDTPLELLARTGDYKFRHSTGAHSGWVRAAGRSIGAAASGASERANADCEALFTLLWEQDATLTVSGGRGSNAASDWAAAKSISLPDIRLRGLIGMGSMGNSLSTLIAAAAFDGGEDADDIGATVGSGTVTLTIAQMPGHNHPASGANANGAHTHDYGDSSVSDPGGLSGGGSFAGSTIVNRTTTSSGLHGHDLTITSQGGGEAHSNVQPSAVATCYLKL